MKRFIVKLCFLTCVSFAGSVSANTTEMPQKPLEQIYSEIGYKAVEEAITEYESLLKKDIQLPFQLPSIPFTHSFGKVNNSNEEMGKYLEVTYIHEMKPQNHYKIEIRPVENKIQFRDTLILNTYIMNDGNKAQYISHTNFNMLVFEKNQWQYILSIDKRIADQVNGDILTSIANSIGEGLKIGNI